MSSRRTRQIWTLIASCALSIALGEVAVRVLLPQPGFVPFPVSETRGIMQPDPARGFAYAPNLSRHVVTSDYEIDFATNSLGLRDVEPDAVDARATHVLAVGDSFTQGFGVQADQAWPKRLQARLDHVHVFDAGVSGYGLQQMRQTAAVFTEPLDSRATLVGVFTGGYNRVGDPFVLVGDRSGLIRRRLVGEYLVLDEGFVVPLFNTPWLRRVAFWIDSHWFLAGNVMHAIFEDRSTDALHGPRDESLERVALVREMKPMLEELDALSREMARRNAPLVALLINPFDPGPTSSPVQHEYNEVTRDFARRHGICVVDPLPFLMERSGGRSLRLGKDSHWNPLAHDLAAARIFETLERSLNSPSEETAPCRPAAEVLLGR